MSNKFGGGALIGLRGGIGVSNRPEFPPGALTVAGAAGPQQPGPAVFGPVMDGVLGTATVRGAVFGVRRTLTGARVTVLARLVFLLAFLVFLFFFHFGLGGALLIERK